MTPDMINGLIEFAGGLFVLNHCRIAWRDKAVRGVSLLSVAFFTSWGMWGLYYYPSLEQWWSFRGCMFIAAANLLWLSLLLRYRG